MKNMLKKLGLVALMTAMIGSTAVAEEEIIVETTPVAETPAVVEVVVTPAPVVEEKTEEPTEVSTEEPAEVTEEPAEVTEEPAEVTEEPAEVIEEPAEVTEEPTMEPTEAPKADPTQKPVAFTGEVEVKLESDGDIYFGDTVTLQAVVKNANAPYEIRWEFNKDGSEDGWKTIQNETKATYSFKVTEENAGYMYRVVLVVAE